MIGVKAFAVLAVLAVTAGSVAGVAIGIVVAVGVDRARAVLGEIEWEGSDD